MKMQKVEVEIPIFDGWEFYKLAKINESNFEKTDTLELARMKAAWIEATRQADEKHAIK